nr:alpha/beta hydrolase family protein [bacterium]
MLHMCVRRYSQSLGMVVPIRVFLPQGEAPEGGWPWMLLLHGLSDDESAWGRFSMAEQRLERLGVAAVMPPAHRSFYTDMAAGGAFYTFIAKELPGAMAQLFYLSLQREKRTVAGLSMGGYGALKLGLKRPGDFCAAAGISSVADIAADYFFEECPWDMEAIFGPGARQTGALAGEDLFALAQAMPPQDCPQLFGCCGTEDFLLEQNRKFNRHMQSLGLPWTYFEAPGTHNWAFFDASLGRMIEKIYAAHLAHPV